jgi:RNA polymerase sigma-70 factor (ECF subfamily)
VGVVARAQVESWLQAKVDASDLVQQTLLDAHRGLGDFRGETEGEWLAWLRQILNHNAADFVRRYGAAEKRRAGREIPIHAGATDDSMPGTLQLSDPGESPSAAVLRHERELMVAEALSRLSADHQEVIRLRNLQRLPFEEIARQMGRSGPATQMLWMRAMKSLQANLPRDPSRQLPKP